MQRVSNKRKDARLSREEKHIIANERRSERERRFVDNWPNNVVTAEDVIRTLLG